MSQKYPIEWSTAPLKDLNEYVSSNMQPKNHIGDFFELFSVPIFPEGKPEIVEASEIGSSKQRVKYNDVLISKINPRINRVWKVSEPKNLEQIASSEWITVRSSFLSSQFLTWYFRANEFRDLLCADVTGVGGSLTRAQPKKVATFNIPVPPLAEQKVIAEKLDKLLAKVDSIKACLDAVPDTLKRFRQSILAAAVSGKLTKEWRKSSTTTAEEDFKALLIQEKEYLDRKQKDNETKVIKEKQKFRKELTNGVVSDIPSGWIAKPFFELCLLNRGFDLPTAKRKAGDYPILSAGGEIGSHNEFKVNGPCITVGRSGSVGQVFYTTLDAWPLNTALYAKSYGFSDPKFVFYKIKSMDLAQYASSTAVPTLNRNEFTHEAVAIPPYSEQTEIVRRVEKLFAYADKVEAEVNAAQERVNKLTQSILAKAFRGELTAKWREQNPDLISGDNSAEALLAKIKAEREKLKPKKKTRTKK
ncbi:restriction endonuclease subunit S [Pseudoalteromonas elyakovii]|nr:restriction endonuclease subunit S [Pseudoalteromonas elyakovii]